LTDSGLRHRQPGSGSSEVQFVRQHHEAAKVTEFHAHTNCEWLYRSIELDTKRAAR